MTSTRAALALALLLVVVAVLFGFIAAEMTVGREQQHHYLPAGEIGSGIHVLPGGKR